MRELNKTETSQRSLFTQERGKRDVMSSQDSNVDMKHLEYLNSHSAAQDSEILHQPDSTDEVTSFGLEVRRQHPPFSPFTQRTVGDLLSSNVAKRANIVTASDFFKPSAYDSSRGFDRGGKTTRKYNSVFSQSGGGEFASTQQANLLNQLFQYPTKPPQEYMNVPWVHQEYEHLVKEVMRINEKLLPLLMKRSFNTSNAQPAKELPPVVKTSPRATARVGGNAPLSKWANDFYQTEFMSARQTARQRSRIKNESLNRRSHQFSLNEFSQVNTAATNATVYEYPSTSDQVSKGKKFSKAPGYSTTRGTSNDN